MNYQVKSVSPGSIFVNAFRLFLFMGFVLALYSFVVLPNPAVQTLNVFKKALAIGLFALVYSTLIGLILFMLSMLYNAWLREFNMRTFFIQSLWPSLIASVFLGLIYGFVRSADGGFFMRALISIVAIVVITPVLAGVTTLLTALANKVTGPFQGATVHLEQQD